MVDRHASGGISDTVRASALAGKPDRQQTRSGLFAGGHGPDPVPDAPDVTSPLHKTLRGPRGGVILTTDKTLAKAVDAAVFPGNQGGPLMHVIVAKAVDLGAAEVKTVGVRVLRVPAAPCAAPSVCGR